MPLKNSDHSALAIRRAVVADAGRICAIEHEASSVSRSLAACEGELSDEHGVSCVALDESGIVCAYIIGVIVLDELHIHSLATQQRFRRQSIATRLMDAVMDLAMRRGVLKAFLEVRSKNGPAIGLYEKCGFSTRLIRKKYYSDDSDDALVMTKDIGLGSVGELYTR
jgi:[ribosomal protein S18]-alanine N-acetyltransferase